MLIVKDVAPEARWIEVAEGVRFLMAPAGLAARARARREAGQLFLAEGPDAGGVEYSLSLIKSCLKEWEGVGDLDGAPIPVSPEAVERMLLDPAHGVIFDLLDREFVGPLLIAVSEKNVSAPSRTGTSGASTRAKATAGTAAKKTSAKPATRSPKTPAPTAGTSRKRSRAKASGK